MIDCYKTEKEVFREIQEKSDKYDALMKKLKEDYKTDTKKVKYYEKAYRDSTSKHDQKSYKRIIDMLNAKRELRKEIITNDYTKM